MNKKGISIKRPRNRLINSNMELYVHISKLFSYNTLSLYHYLRSVAPDYAGSFEPVWHELNSHQKYNIIPKLRKAGLIKGKRIVDHDQATRSLLPNLKKITALKLRRTRFSTKEIKALMIAGARTYLTRNFLKGKTHKNFSETNQEFNDYPLILTGKHSAQNLVYESFVRQDKFLGNVVTYSRSGYQYDSYSTRITRKLLSEMLGLSMQWITNYSRQAKKIDGDIFKDKELVLANANDMDAGRCFYHYGFQEYVKVLPTLVHTRQIIKKIKSSKLSSPLSSIDSSFISKKNPFFSSRKESITITKTET